MEHLAIMKKEWHFIEKILSGEKKIESRWYASRRTPWDKISAGDLVYFKNSGEAVTANSEVEKVMQFQDLDPDKVKELLEEYGDADGIRKDEIDKFFELFKDKRYCMLVFLKNSRNIPPFRIDKKGFGVMSAWITLDHIRSIKIDAKQKQDS